MGLVKWIGRSNEQLRNGLLVTLLIRTQRQKQRLLASGLSDHYQQIFELTKLNRTIGSYATEAVALAAGVMAGGRWLVAVDE